MSAAVISSLRWGTDTRLDSAISIDQEMSVTQPLCILNTVVKRPDTSYMCVFYHILSKTAPSHGIVIPFPPHKALAMLEYVFPEPIYNIGSVFLGTTYFTSHSYSQQALFFSESTSSLFPLSLFSSGEAFLLLSMWLHKALQMTSALSLSLNSGLRPRREREIAGLQQRQCMV